MQASDNSVVTIHYKLTNDAGEVIDSSQGHEPLAYLHGNQNIIPGLEKALDGRSAGDTFDVSLSPEEAYGARDETLIEDLPKTAVQSSGDLLAGEQVQAKTSGGIELVTVVRSEGDNVTVDRNHPLAGETLHFEVEVVEIRAATEEELAHGHVHGAHGHH